jgi:hypothetical protein
MFWGYASGTDHRVRKQRALGKTKMLFEGRKSDDPRRVVEPDQIPGIMKAFHTTRCNVRNGDFGAALLSANGMKFWGFSFASKLVMFLDSGNAVVYDSVIWDRLRIDPDPALRKMAEVPVKDYTQSQRTRKAIGEQYEQWCRWCSNKARVFNELGVQWRVWDGKSHDWRAVDVERAYFADGRPAR